MAQSVFPEPSSASKTRKVQTLISGTSWIVPAGVNSINVKLVGGGQGSGSGGGYGGDATGVQGAGGSVVESTVVTTPGATILYSIGAGGGGTSGYLGGYSGGSTTFTGATTAPGGDTASQYLSAGNGARGGSITSSSTSGGPGCIIIEYWV